MNHDVNLNQHQNGVR